MDKPERKFPVEISLLTRMKEFLQIYPTQFWLLFWGMLVHTTGMIMVIPTANTFTANQAPVTMRGRYMSLLALTWGAGSMIGPLLGGFLNDTFNPRAIWYGRGAAGVLGALIYLDLILSKKRQGDWVRG